MNITDKTLQSYIRQSQKDTSKKYHLYSVGNNLWFRVHSNTGNATWLFRIALYPINIQVNQVNGDNARVSITTE